MKKIIFRIVILAVLALLVLLIYLSTTGIKTNRLNNQISNQIKNINENLEIKLNDVNIVLDPLKLKFNVKTLGVNLEYQNKKIQLERISSSISIKSLLNKQFLLKDLKISTKSIKIKDFFPFIRMINNDPKIYIAENFIKKGFIIADLNIEFDNNGNIKENYQINGYVKDGKINLFKKYDLSKIDFFFDIKKNNFELVNFNLSINDKNFLATNVKIIKQKNKFLVSGKFSNEKTILSTSEIKDLLNTDTTDLDIDKIEFESDNTFSFNIDKKFKFENLEINSSIFLNNLIFLNDFGLKKIFPEFNKEFILKDHKISLNYSQNILNIEGQGNFFIKDEDKIDYKITKSVNKVDFNSTIKVSNNLLEIDFLNYQNNDKSNLKINIKGNKDLKGNIFFEKISLNESKNNINIKNLLLKHDYSIEKFEKIDLDYLDKEKIENKFSIIRKDQNYILNGKSLNANKLIESLLESENKKKKLFSNDFRLNIDIVKTYLDKKNTIKNLMGYLVFKNNIVLEANLNSSFSNNEKILFTINTKSDEKITTLFSARAKPLVDRYKFIKGFNEGSLDFYSIKKNDDTVSTLKIYDFKLKELPALTKILTLASLQGIADLLSGEGIRFNDFEMNFSNKDNLMTINEIYAIGPAISLLMDGYIEKDKLISLRGTLVPATTLNKTIGSIPIIGDILVGKKTGEGVFGVSFKIKGPPKNLETSVNPIKTLTPRFITRTLEKIKKN